MIKVSKKNSPGKSKKEGKTIKEKHTIMVVDDEERQLTSLDSLLSEEYDIILAHDGQTALDIIKNMEHMEEISLIIYDQSLPGIKGLHLFEKIKDIIPLTIRMILTAFDDKDVMMHAINKAKIDKFILKPFEPEELKNLIRRAVESFERQRKSDNHLKALEEKYQRLLQKVKKLEKINKQIKKKLAVLNSLDSIIVNSQTREAEIHKIFETNLWILGDEYSIMSSNKTLKNIVRKFVGKRYKGDSANYRPDLLLAQDIKDTYLLIEFKKPFHELNRANEYQTVIYRDKLRKYFPNSRIEIMLIGGGINEEISSEYPGKDVKYLSYQKVISRARKKLNSLIEE